MTTQDYKDKNIIQDIGYKEFSAICKEYQIVETATKNLLDIANDLNTPLKVRVNIYKWLVEMNTGKPKQITDITTGSKPTQVSFDLLDNNTELQISEVLGNKE